MRIKIFFRFNVSSIRNRLMRPLSMVEIAITVRLPYPYTHTRGHIVANALKEYAEMSLLNVASICLKKAKSPEKYDLIINGCASDSY